MLFKAKIFNLTGFKTVGNFLGFLTLYLSGGGQNSTKCYILGESRNNSNPHSIFDSYDNKQSNLIKTKNCSDYLFFAGFKDKFLLEFAERGGGQYVRG